MSPNPAVQQLTETQLPGPAPDLPCQNPAWEVGICLLSKSARLFDAAGPETGV